MQVRHLLQTASTEILRRDTETLLLHLLGQDRAWLLAHPDSEVPTDLCNAFNSLVIRRARHEPLQYLTGSQEFYGLPLHVTPAVLIPRPETEILVEAVLTWAMSQPASASRTPLHLVDVGTGSGAIALALAAHLPTTTITALDQSPAALEVAEANAERLGLASSRLRFGLSDLLDVLPPATSPGEQQPHANRRAKTREMSTIQTSDAMHAIDDIDAIVSNPPYVPEADAPTLQPEVREFEPHLALFAGQDGLAIYRRLIPQARRALRPGSLLALEFGFGQKDALSSLLHTWHNVRFLEDLAGIPRVVLAQRP